MKETIKTYTLIIAGVIIIVLLLFKGCVNPLPKLSGEETTTIVSDTVFSVDTLVEFKTIIKPKYTTIYKIDTLIEQARLDSLPLMRVYNDSLSDSTLTIFTKIKTFGYLDEVKLSYKLKVKPVLITNTITNIKIETKTPKISIYTGVELGGNKSSFNLSPFICMNINKSSLSYRYEILNKTHSVGVGYKIFNSRK